MLKEDNIEQIGRLMTAQWTASNTTQHIEKAYLIVSDLENSLDAKTPDAINAARLKQTLKETLNRAYVTQSAVSYLGEVI